MIIKQAKFNSKQALRAILQIRKGLRIGKVLDIAKEGN